MNNLSILQKIKIINLFSFLWFIVAFPLYSLVKSNTKSGVGKTLLPTKNCTKLEQVILLLNRVDSPFIKENKQEQSAFLLRASVVLGEYTCEMLLDLLATVDNHLSYWQKMRDSSNYYFFHKSPLKWITGKNQQEETNNNIQFLSTIQKKYLKTLGMLTKHVQQFNDNEIIDERYAWLGQLSMITQTLYMRCDKVNVIDCEHATSAMRQVLKNILPYKNRALLVIGKAKPPCHFVRNWMRYAILFIGTGFVYKNRVLTDKWVSKKMQNKYKKSLGRAWYEYFINPMKDAYDIIMINKEQKRFNVASDIQNKEGLIAQNRLLLEKEEKQMQQYIENTKQRSVIACKSIKKDLEKKQEAGLITIEKKKEILSDINKDDTGSLQQFINDLPMIKFSLGGIEVTAAKPIWNLLQYIGFSDGQKVVNDIRSTLNHASKVLIDVDEALVDSRKILLYCVDSLDSELKKNQMTLKLTALVPAIVTGWGMYKLTSTFYVWLTRCNYSVMRNIIFQINAMIIEFQGDIDDEYFGKFLYLLYKLKRAALVQISQKNVRREFLRDIEMLSWDYMAKEKRLLIDNMRWKYDFLSPVYNV